jgi:hypothetical protein
MAWSGRCSGEDSPEWEIKPASGAAPRTIAEYGGCVVLAAALAAALLAGVLIYHLR